jgi:3-keto-5-aminohexanoate cleavage enzyme
MYTSVGILKKPYQVSFVMGVASGMPAKPEWLPLLANELAPGTHWQVIAIGTSSNILICFEFIPSRS